MKWIVTSTKEGTNDMSMWEYETEDAAIDNIKHMRIVELQPHMEKQNIRLFKAEEVDISNVDGYTMDEVVRRYNN